MVDVILDTLLDVARLLPFLFLTYLLMEYLEHRSGDAAKGWLKKSGKVGPLFGAAFGALPQCGFSAAASGLYTGRVITTGTLIAVYLSTSDEMLPILISNGAPASLIFKTLGIKVAVGAVAGFAVDLVTVLFRKKHPAKEENEAGFEDLCEREHCNCGDHFALSALKHTLRITVFLLLFIFLMNLAVFLIGEDRLAAWIPQNPVLNRTCAALVGLIPNCASSVVLTELYLSGILPFGAMISGLLVNAGVGLAVLFRNNRPFRDSLRILALLFTVGVLAGLIF